MTESRLHRRRLLHLMASGAAGLALPACAGAPERSLRPPERPVDSSDRIVDRAGLGGNVAYAVMDLSTGALLEGQNATTPLPPASVAKSVTALYALDALGPNHSYQTRLIATGPVQDGVLRGDLILAGGGDPTLETDNLARMAAQLAQGGVRQVSGAFLVWGGALPRILQIADDQPVQAGYNAAVSGLNLNFNRVHFEWQRTGSTYRVSMDARSNAHRPAVDMATMQVADRAAPLYTHRRTTDQDIWTVARPALGANGSRWLPVRHPELYTGQAFRALARAQGVTLPAPRLGTSSPQGQVLVTHRSAPMTQLASEMLRFSTNITAEALGLSASLARGAQIGDLRASGVAMTNWARARYGKTSAAYVDHSGLGASSRVSMFDLCTMFRGAAQDGALRAILREHPFRDEQGRTIANPGIDVRAKTGTLNFVSALGGYVRGPGGRDLVFAICSADLERRARVAGGQAERPDGAAQFAQAARRMQQDLLTRWSRTYGA